MVSRAFTEQENIAESKNHRRTSLHEHHNSIKLDAQQSVVLCDVREEVDDIVEELFR